MCIKIVPEEKALVNDKGVKVYPSCFIDLYAYYSYLCGSGKSKEAHKVLKRVFHGERVISDMIANMHKINK